MSETPRRSKPELESAEDGPDTYPEPKRSWPRSGALLAGWAVTWAAVGVLGISWQAVAEPGSDRVADAPTSSEQQTVRRHFTTIFVDRDPGEAAATHCAEYSGPTTDDMYTVLSGWEEQEGSSSARDIVPSQVGGDTSRFQVRVDYGSPDNRQVHVYEATVVPEGDTYCIATVHDVTAERDDEPEDDESDDPALERTARETAEGFWDVVLAGEDPAEASEAWQCEQYSGEMPEELFDELEADATVTELDTRQVETAGSDGYRAEITLADDTIRYFATDVEFAESPPCVTAVVETPEED